MSDELKDFKNTLLLPVTEFPMRSNLGEREPLMEEKWFNDKIYEKRLEKNKGNKEFYLHDGPPYANGPIHVGHALNKVLKDFIIRYKSMNGYYAPYLPGWDTHGLPIEQALTKKLNVNRKAMPTAEFRSMCEKYALEQIELQKAGFKRLGVLGEWDNPYITLTHDFEATQIRTFGKMVKKGLIFKGLKPVYWSPSSETALAEAEIEYKDVPATSIYVAFPAVDTKGLLPVDTWFVIWTTTPWTMPANLAICAGPNFTYALIEADGRKFLMAKDLLDAACKEIGFESYNILQEIDGTMLEGMTYRHPLYNRVSPIILGDHVTLESGTGLVHTAPGHGDDDFIVGKKYNLDILCPVDSKGYMTEEAGEFKGLFYEEANDVIIERLKEEKMLLKSIKFMHSYPHDWRTGKPIIFRATPQWFASIAMFKDDILNVIKDVKWYPAWGDVRLSNMIKDRADWCISRQRVWGVPIPVFYCENGDAILDENVINHVADLFGEFGSNVWFEREAKDLLPEGYTNPASPNGIFTKEMDIMDVWFDSGTSHHGALENRYGTHVADVYLEGSDQYRGWFNSSLITSVALEGVAPYKTVISHGFTLDGKGRKMSKSLGNTIDPKDICKEFGADIFRLWVSSVDYQSDASISKEIIKQVVESYRKIRNTFRFLLGNTFDFDYTKDYVPYEELGDVDKYILCRLDDCVKESLASYDEYQFQGVFRNAVKFMSNELSSFYLDYTKDILYIYESKSLERRKVQTVLYECLMAFATLLTPIIPHTTDEVYSYIVNKKYENVYLEDMVQPKNYADKEEVLGKFARLNVVRDDVLKALEEARNEKVIGKSLNASLTVCLNKEYKDLTTLFNFNFNQVFIVSNIKFVDELTDGKVYPTAKIKVEAATGATCARCWNIVPTVDSDCLCERCSKIIKRITR